MFWRSRVEDMKRILDQLDFIEASVPGLSGRLDRSRAAVVGHSMGGHTAGMLLGERLTDPKDGTIIDMAEPRIKAGVLLAAPGNGGADLSAFAAEQYSFFRSPSFAEMTTPALVVFGDGDNDVSHHLTVRGADWRADPYFLSKGPKCLLTMFGARHSLGGVAGYDAAENRRRKPRTGGCRPAAYLGLPPLRALPGEILLVPRRALPSRRSRNWAGSNANDARRGAGYNPPAITQARLRRRLAPERSDAWPDHEQAALAAHRCKKGDYCAR